ncbi:hypothetical protein ACIHFC_29005 [Streptomyces sp. NPDC052013]|uniref:hypothetical protein n=1 Tax=Streptomyces sp. NPDC052013 TaxID=3365679 RepID=UPI0037D05550
MTRRVTPVMGSLQAGKRDWIRVPMAVPTVWMATPDGLVCLDLIAVELAANGMRQGWTLTSDEARYAAVVMFRHGLTYSVIAHRIGVSGSTLKSWFPGKAVPDAEWMARPRAPRTASGQQPTLGAKCGTTQGYKRHRRRKELACALCKAAKAAANRHYRRHGTYVGAPEVVA